MSSFIPTTYPYHKISWLINRYHLSSHAIIYNFQVDHSNLLAEIAKQKYGNRFSYRAAEAVSIKTTVTTYVFTATKLSISSSAGITAAAGTRLALHWILTKVFKLCSFRLAKLGSPAIVIVFRCLTVLALGNLRACCLPWMW